MIRIINNQNISLDTSWIHSVLEELMKFTQYEDFDLGVLFTTNESIAQYNKQYRHKEGPTDILSFSSYPDQVPGTQIKALSQEEKDLGDLILAPDYIQTSAQDLGVDFEQRLLILLIHGLCHLLGYDHETDEQYELMQAKETELLKRLSPQLTR